MLKLDGRSDLYSLGCTMYHLLSGKLPFQGESSMDCIVGRIMGQAIPISEVRPGLPPRLVETIEKMMATDPMIGFRRPMRPPPRCGACCDRRTRSRPAPTVEAQPPPSPRKLRSKLQLLRPLRHPSGRRFPCRNRSRNRLRSHWTGPRKEDQASSHRVRGRSRGCRIDCRHAHATQAVGGRYSSHPRK